MKVNFLVSAALSFVIVFLLYGDELARRLGEYLLVYSSIFAFVVVGLIIASGSFIGSPTVLRIVALGVFVGYISGVVAHFLAVLLDVSGIRSVHPPIPVSALVIPFFFPFLVLKGWVFSVLFIFVALILNFLLNRCNKMHPEDKTRVWRCG